MGKNFTTKSGYRFLVESITARSDYNWVFLPGGPGFGSEYFIDYINEAQLPGTVWRLDFPGDGSNRNSSDYSLWQKDLVPALKNLEKVILVTHSFSGLLALTVPKLEFALEGLVVIGAAPDNQWQVEVAQRCRARNVEDGAHYAAEYALHKTDTSFRTWTLATWDLYVNKESKEKAQRIFETLPYNHKAYDWYENVFDPKYKALWVPQVLPTLLLAGLDDLLIPLCFFQNDMRFNRSNITFKEIIGASHFPWIERPEEVTQALTDFYKNLRS